MKYKIGDYIKLKPNAEVNLSYKKGSPPQKLITNGIWRIDDIEELEDDIQSLYITIVSGNYNPGSFGSWVSNGDVLKLVNTTKENKTMKKSELITLIKEVIQEDAKFEMKIKKDLDVLQNKLDDVIDQLADNTENPKPLSRIKINFSTEFIKLRSLVK